MLWLSSKAKRFAWKSSRQQAKCCPYTTWYKMQRMRMAYLSIIMDPRATGSLKVIFRISLPPIGNGETCFIILQGGRSHTLSYSSLYHNLCWWVGLYDRSFFLILIPVYTELLQVCGLKSLSGLLQEKDTWNLLGFPQPTALSLIPPSPNLPH